MPQLEVADGRQLFAQEILVPALLRVRPFAPFPWLGRVDALVGVGEGLIDVHLVDDVLHRQGAEGLEALRRSVVDGFDDDGDVGVDFANGLRGTHLEREAVVALRRMVGLVRLVHQVIGDDRGRALEAPGDAAPSLHVVVRVFRLVEHVHLMVGGAAPRRHVQIDDDLDAVFRGEGDDALL